MSASVLDTAERRLFEIDADGNAPAASGDVPTASEQLSAAFPRAGANDAALRRFLARLVTWKPLDFRRAAAEALSTELARGTAFCFIPVLLIAGALAYFFAPVEPPLWFVAIAPAPPLALALAAGRRPAVRMAFAALFCIAFGALLAKAETALAGTRMLGSEISTRLMGRIASMDQLADGRVRLLIDVMSTERPTLRYAPERVRVSARNIPAGARAGDVVAGVVRLLPPLGPTRPGGYDFSFESYFDGIGAIGFFLTAPVLVEAPDPPSWGGRLRAGIENARDALAAHIRSRVGGAEGEIAAALVSGVRAGIPEEVNESLRRTGLAHILSISGLHMALVAAWIMGVIRLTFACFQNFAMRHPVRKYAAVIALLALAAYLFLSGYQVAAQRSFIMIAIMLIAVLFDRAALTMRNLALAAIVIMALSPHEAAGPSFQMSFGATAALIGAYAAWSERKRRYPPSSPTSPLLPRGVRTAMLYIGGLAATSLLAGAATAIFGAYHFQRVSPLGLVANLAAMPIVSLLVMPFALLGVLLMPLGLDWIAFAVMGWGLRLVIGISEWFSMHSPIDAVGMIAPEAAILLSAALVLASLLTTWLRFAALPFALAGLAFCLAPPQPKILVSEDARLVAVDGEDGTIYVNRRRPNEFAIENWKRALGADIVARPVMLSGEGAALRQGEVEAAKPDQRFRCGAAACLAITANGTVLITSDADRARSACGHAGVIVLDDATAENVCAGSATLVVTRRDLALRGSAMIFVGEAGSGALEASTERAEASGGQARSFGPTWTDTSTSAAAATGSIGAAIHSYEIRFAAAKPLRPWHQHRRFSREARGLPPWKPTRQKAGGPETSSPGVHRQDSR